MAKRTRVERLEAERATRRRRALRSRLIVVGIVLALVVAAATAFIVDRRNEQRAVAKVETGTCKYDTDFDGDAGTNRNHVPSPTYRVDPPAGGDHLAVAARAARYTTANLPPDGQLVHAMEHGFIVLWHHPDLSEPDQKAVEALADRFPEELLVVPRQSMTTPVAVTAWHRRTLCQKVEPDAIAEFITQFRDQGPEKGFL